MVIEKDILSLEIRSPPHPKPCGKLSLHTAFKARCGQTSFGWPTDFEGGGLVGNGKATWLMLEDSHGNWNTMRRGDSLASPTLMVP